MALYDVNGDNLSSVYGIDETELSDAYDISGNNVFNSGGSDDPYIEGRVLAWEDRFDGEQGVAPNASKWGHEVGSVRNPSWEKQYYTDGNANSYLDGQGHLIIKAIKENIGSKTWSSASINTNNIFEFAYGRVEAKIKLPHQSGAVPAFWMLGSGLEVVPLGYYDPTTQKDNEEKGILTPLCPEVDIVEQFGANSTIQSAVHVGTEEGGAYTLHYMPTLAIEDTTQWHVYAVEWTSKTLSWYVDDVQVGFSNAPQTYPMLNKPMYILLNIAIGNVNSSGNPNNDDKEMDVDWIRVYLPEGVLEKYPVTSLELSQQSLSLAVNETAIIDFTFAPELCWNKTIVWSSSDSNVAQVYGGKVYGIAEGTCIITAIAYNGITATCAVSVTAS